MNTIFILNLLITLIVISSIFILTSQVLFKFILIPYKNKSIPLSLEEILTNIDLLVGLELSIYEENIFKLNGAILNSSSIENYYNEITNKILSDISDSFFERSSFIMDDTVIADIIARKVLNYLTTKLATPNKNIEKTL